LPFVIEQWCAYGRDGRDVIQTYRTH